MPVARNRRADAATPEPVRRRPARSSAPAGPPSGNAPPTRGNAPPAREAVDGPAGTGWRPRLTRAVGGVVDSPRQTMLVTGLVAAGTGLLLAGPVAAAAAAGYGLLGMRALLRQQATRRAERDRRRRLDQLCGLAADLRAGLPVPVSLRPDGDDSSDDTDRIEQLAAAAVRLAEQTGAPLAELLERVEADTRVGDRGLASAAAQAAGARATAWLLAALPLGGIGLGYGIGVDPVAILLHTPIGAACTLAAVALQAVGLAWADRLTALPGRAGWCPR
ncbi:hypothetical protein [Micromonospora sp. SH-82]|uniref:hypothetical protein n=1 Tax=Micromonospora sp. SH-82 TaxID=3132938 RepID=UPI003EBC0E48